MADLSFSLSESEKDAGSTIGWQKLLTQLSRSKLKLILADTDSNSKKW